MKTLIVGFGSPHGDDQLGWHVIDILQQQINTENTKISVFKSKGNSMDWMSSIDDAEQIILVDAVISGSDVGTLHYFFIENTTDKISAATSSHGIDLLESVAVARNVGILNIPVHFFGIEIESNKPLSAISKIVEKKIPELVARVREVLS